MAQIFISHSSKNDFAAVAIRDWLAEEGWNDIFLDLDPKKGINPGEYWERELYRHASECEAIIILVSRSWLSSEWCRNEYELSRKLNKRVFVALIELIALAKLPTYLKQSQIVSLSGGEDHRLFQVVRPGTHRQGHVTFSEEGLTRLKAGLTQAGLDPRFFQWPPPGEPDRLPYRGLAAIDALDAGVFFGREGPIIDALDTLRGMHKEAPPRAFVILGASGAGKSSFLRAGLLPRLARDTTNFLCLPVVRPGRAAISGLSGFEVSLAGACARARFGVTRADVRDMIGRGSSSLQSLIAELIRHTAKAADPSNKPTLLIPIDQAEELFTAEGTIEGGLLLRLLGELAGAEAPRIIPLFAIRSDAYDLLERSERLEGITQKPFSLRPMPRGAYQTVIEGPVRRVLEAGKRFELDPALTQALLHDVENSGGGDALALLAFTMEQLYINHFNGRRLTLTDYQRFGRLSGAIEAAMARVFEAADADPRIPRDQGARLVLLRRGLIPWLAGIDPETRTPRRRIARIAHIPPEARPLVDLLITQRLLTSDVDDETGEVTIEPSHEAFLRQWGLLQGWLVEDFALLSTLESVKRAARDWDANSRSSGWLVHQGERLSEARALSVRPDISAKLDSTDDAYLSQCTLKERRARRRTLVVQSSIYSLLGAIILGLISWINQSYVAERWNWFFIMRPHMLSNVRPHVLSLSAEISLQPGSSFRECAKNCPEMVVVPSGTFLMGAPEAEIYMDDNKGPRRDPSESPQHEVSIARRFAVSKTAVTFSQWDECVSVGGCPNVSDSGMGRNQKPVINVSWNDAQHYISWLSQMTGKPYRLLTEAEWEYSAKAGSKTAYFWGSEIGTGRANCDGCGSRWDNKETSPVASFVSNAFGLYDMAGNVWQWVEDCHHASYDGAPTNGAAWLTGNCNRRVNRGGSWTYRPQYLRSTNRDWNAPVDRHSGLGFRVARTLVE